MAENMLNATEIRIGNVVKSNNKPCKVLAQEIKGTGKFGKTVHLKVKSLDDGRIHELSLRAEEKIEECDVERVTMQYLYRQGDGFVFMNTTDFEQYTIPASSVGKQDAFLKEEMEINVLFVDGKPMSIDFPKTAELKVTVSPPGTKGGSDSTYKEVELENGLKLLVPQFVKEGESVRINVEDLSYLERVTTKSMKTHTKQQKLDKKEE